MWSDEPVHRELTTRPSHLPAEVNYHRIHNPAAVAPVPNAAPRNNGKSRPERACDLCRRRKTKCDGPSAPDSACSNCVQNNQSCTYLCAYIHTSLSLCLSSPLSEVSRPRGPPKAFVPNSHSPSFFRFPAYTPLLQLCLRPRGPPGEDGSTAQESAYPTSLLAPHPSEPECLITQLRPEVDLTQHLGPPIIRDSWKSDAQLSTSAPRPFSKGNRNPPSLNPLDHSLTAQRKSSDAESVDLVPSDNEEPLFDCEKRSLNPDTPSFLDAETDKGTGDAGDTTVDPGTRLYGKSSDMHLVGPAVYWKCLHIKEVTPPDPQPETQPPDQGMFPKVRRPIYWGPPFPVSHHPSISHCTSPRSNPILINPQVGTGLGGCPSDETRSFPFCSGHLPLS